MPRPPRPVRAAVLALGTVLVAALAAVAPAAPASAVSGVLIVSPERDAVVPASVRVDVRAFEATSVDVSVDGAVRGTDTSPEPYQDSYSRPDSGYQLFSVVVDLSGLSGKHVLGAVGRNGGESREATSLEVVVDTTAPALTVPASLAASGPTVLTASEPLLAPTSGGAVLRDSKGARLPLSVFCHTSADPKSGARACEGTGATRYLGIQPSSGQLVVGERYVLELAATVTDVAGNRPARTSYPVRASTRPGFLDLHWSSVRRSGSVGGTYLQSRDTGASLQVLTGDSSLSIRVVKGPGLGVLSVSGGRSALRVDLYSPTVQYATVRYDFGCGSSCFLQFGQLGVTGSRNPRSTGTAVAVDDVTARTGSGPVRPAALIEGWVQIRAAGASDGALAMSSTPGSYAQLRFRSTRVDWTTSLGPDQGLADVYVDGRRISRVDGYAPARRIVHRSFAVPDGVHVLRVVPVGRGRAEARGAYVGVDDFSVR